MDILKKADQKKKIRQTVKQYRLELTQSEKEMLDEGIFHNFQKIYSTSLFEKCDIIYCYADCNNEVSTKKIVEFLWKHGIKTAFPRVNGKEMSFFLVNHKHELKNGYMGILEPADFCEEARKKNAVVLVPGVAFDRNGLRLGYGGGFYDRFFEREKEHIKIGLAYDFQVFSQIPSQPWDCKMDGMIMPEQYLIFHSMKNQRKDT